MKKLRDLYMKDPAAKKFLEENPEFDNRFLEQAELKNKPFNDQKGRYSLQEPDPFKRAHIQKIIDGMALMEEGGQKALLQMYFEQSLPLSEIAKVIKAPNTQVVKQRLHRAKRTALRIYYANTSA